MKVADLYIQIGIKGDKEVGGALSTITGELGAASMAAGKIALALGAAVAAFRKLGEQSNEAGFGLKEFELVQDSTSDTLQRWAQLSIHAGHSADEMKESFQQLAKTMFLFTTTGQQIKWLPQLNMEMERLGRPINPAKYKDTGYMMGVLRDFALHAGKDMTNVQIMEVLESFVSHGTALAMRKSEGFDLSHIDKNRTYTKGEQNRLSGMKIQWDEFIDGIEHTIGHLNAHFGPAVLHDIVEVGKATEKFALAMGHLADIMKLPAFLDFMARFATSAIKAVSTVDIPKSARMPDLSGMDPETQARYLQNFGGMSKAASVTVTNHNSFTANGMQADERIMQMHEQVNARQYHDAMRQINKGNTGGQN